MTTPGRDRPNFFIGGPLVTCTTCGKQKQPSARSAPMAASYCDHDCGGYNERPYANDLWPGEKREDFGYPAQFVADMLERDKRLEASAYLRGLEAAAKICEAYAHRNRGIQEELAAEELIAEIRAVIASADRSRQWLDCNACGGSGKYDEDRLVMDGHYTETIECSTCGGSGKAKPTDVAGGGK